MKAIEFRTELHVPAVADFADLVDRFCADAANRADLDPSKAAGMLAAARFGFNVISGQAMGEARDLVRIVATANALELHLSLFERGLPIDDAFARRDPRWNALLGEVDEAHWRLHGAAGSELRLIARRAAGVRLEFADAAGASENVAPAPPQEYEIRRFRPGDAAGIARAFYLTYGYHYDFPAVYVPERLAHLNALGRYVSIVAIGADGDVAGHYALAREGDEPIADGCGAVVAPAHRGRNLLNLMRAQAEREAKALGLAAYFTEPVTDHGRTQHASETFGAKACGISLGTVSRNFLAKHMELSNTTQRQSFMLYVKPLEGRERRIAYVPRRHAAIVAKIYEQLGLPVDVTSSGSPASHESEIKASILRADEIGTITVERAGATAAEQARQSIEDLKSVARLGGIYASLPLDDPGTPDLCEALESHGLFFAGVGPWMQNGRDALRLQMPLTPIDLSALTVVGEFGQELLAYVRAERERVGS